MHLYVPYYIFRNSYFFIELHPNLLIVIRLCDVFENIQYNFDNIADLQGFPILFIMLSAFHTILYLASYNIPIV